jgi:stage III sporulation protein AA
LKVGVVDERSEIAACHRGIPQNDLGARTDVLDNCPKEQGMRMLLRSMSPEILAVDELGEKREFATVAESAKSGVAVLATMHADTVFEVQNRLAKEGLEGLFPAMRLIGIGKQPSGKRRLHIYEGSGAILWQDG